MHPYTAMKAANERVGGAGAAPTGIRGGLAPRDEELQRVIRAVPGGGRGE